MFLHNWGFLPSAGSMQEIYKRQTDPHGNEEMKELSKKKNEKYTFSKITRYFSLEDKPSV